MRIANVSNVGTRAPSPRMKNRRKSSVNESPATFARASAGAFCGKLFALSSGAIVIGSSIRHSAAGVYRHRTVRVNVLHLDRRSERPRFRTLTVPRPPRAGRRAHRFTTPQSLVNRAARTCAAIRITTAGPTPVPSVRLTPFFITGYSPRGRRYVSAALRISGRAHLDGQVRQHSHSRRPATQPLPA